LYPGARPQKDTEDDSPQAKFGLWGNALAFKRAVPKLESSDPMDKTAAFYKKALTKYGTVLRRIAGFRKRKIDTVDDVL